MLKRAVLMFVIAAFTIGISARVIKKAGNMDNTNMAYVDSFYVDSTESKFTQAFPIDIYSKYSLLVEAREDSTDGFSGDTAAVRVQLYQAWPITSGNCEYFVTLKSHGADSTLWDSLDIHDMDTLAAYHRDFVMDSAGGQARGRTWGDSLVLLDTNSTLNAFAYKDFTPEYSPAVTFKVTGLSGANMTSGAGSFWKFRVFGKGGEPVKTK